MRHRSITVILSIGIGLAAIMLVSGSGRFHFPDNHQGYEPEQPIAFSHRLHAGEMGISCHYCHSAAEDSRHAGIPAVNTCMNCHRFVPATSGAIRAEEEAANEQGRDIQRVISPEIKKVYEAAAVDPENDFAPLADKLARPIPWVKVHNLPSFVYFDHRAHVNSGVDCQTCHGAVENMERIRQVESLSMGWCVNCHRDVNENGVNGNHVHASVDCDVCHH